MPNTTLGRSRSLNLNLNLCFTNLIKRPSSLPPPSQPQSSTTPLHHNRPFLIKNFNSLYDESSSVASSDGDHHNEPDLATALASQRFFFSSPGRSNSIIESTPSIATTSTDSNHDPLIPDTCHHHHHQSRESISNCSITNNNIQFPAVKDSVAVPTISPDPYADFRRSMQEMVEAREMGDVMANWEYLHELLLCYLNLNPKSTHKFIVSAFADLLVSLLSKQQAAQDDGGGRRGSDDDLGGNGGGGGCEISRQQHM